MRIRKFVSTSAILLAGWLGYTFIHEVPTQRYPKLDKYTAAPTRMTGPETLEMTANTAEAELFQISVSP